jgi:cell wall-associated NlpC family hydrolase
MNLMPYLGLPYVPHESDCWTLVRRFAAEQLGKNLPEYMYDTSTILEDAQAQIENQKHYLGKLWTQVKKPELGDILIFRIFSKECHVGICLGGNDFLHTLKGRNSCIERLSDQNWNNRLTGAYRYAD